VCPQAPSVRPLCEERPFERVIFPTRNRKSCQFRIISSAHFLYFFPECLFQYVRYCFSIRSLPLIPYFKCWARLWIASVFRAPCRMVLPSPHGRDISFFPCLFYTHFLLTATAVINTLTFSPSPTVIPRRRMKNLPFKRMVGTWNSPPTIPYVRYFSPKLLVRPVYPIMGGSVGLRPLLPTRASAQPRPFFLRMSALYTQNRVLRVLKLFSPPPISHSVRTPNR